MCLNTFGLGQPSALSYPNKIMQKKWPTTFGLLWSPPPLSLLEEFQKKAALFFGEALLDCKVLAKKESGAFIRGGLHDITLPLVEGHHFPYLVTEGEDLVLVLYYLFPKTCVRVLVDFIGQNSVLPRWHPPVQKKEENQSVFS